MVNYDNENWHLLSEKMSTLPELIRTQLLHDALTLSLSGHLNTVVALNMTNFLKKEQSPVVWRTFYPLADRLRKQFEGTDAAKGIDVSFVLNLYNNLAKCACMVCLYSKNHKTYYSLIINLYKICSIKQYINNFSFNLKRNESL